MTRPIPNVAYSSQCGVAVRQKSWVLISGKRWSRPKAAELPSSSFVYLQCRCTPLGAFNLKYKTASPLKGGVNVLVAPPFTSAPAVLAPVAAFIHSTANRPLTARKIHGKAAAGRGIDQEFRIGRRWCWQGHGRWKKDSPVASWRPDSCDRHNHGYSPWCRAHSPNAHPAPNQFHSTGDGQRLRFSRG